MNRRNVMRMVAILSASVVTGFSNAVGNVLRKSVPRHILPNLIGPVTVYGLLVVPQAILQESFLSFLGIGIPQPVPSLGRLASDGVEAVNTFVGFWWLLAYPCLALVIVLLSLNVIINWHCL